LAGGRRAPVGDHARDRRRAAGDRVLGSDVRPRRRVDPSPRASAGPPGARAEAADLRLSTRPIDQSQALAPSPAYQTGVLRGAYRLLDARGEAGWDPEVNAVSLFAAGVIVPEAITAQRALRERGILASVFAGASPRRLY